MIAKVLNLPDYAFKHPHIVARLVNHDLYFYGAYDDESKAYEVAKMVDGIVLANEEVTA